jgi:hypothetical protein
MLLQLQQALGWMESGALECLVWCNLGESRGPIVWHNVPHLWLDRCQTVISRCIQAQIVVSV